MKRDFAVAVKAVIVKEDKVLVLRRSRREMECSYMNKYQKWDLPGGGLHFYEKAEDGLRREIREETTLQVSIGTPVSMFDVIRRQVHLCIFTYACRWEAGEVRLSEEHEAYIWMTGEEVAQSTLPFWMKRDLLRGLEQFGKNA
ncbi:NUDIX domain-containing protein [Anaerotignum lactatifermentans]|uniref:NUDIX domain-containing protein n=1 Tax=Anaerotignum lactatifermentans TaxID=160404 RepID=A0ABS2GAG2_9FIRM|nr:NUDIX domain-containing protein [Anaerotignum lactatifermentans]MBM6877618.1 NUDIX domain-containing protein [Anaerotignum lactatifermentans]MBM6949921.1 NUDIX domain-containing protein [Anaerotignum lactatifermentans]